MFQTRNREKWRNERIADIHTFRNIYFCLLTAQYELYIWQIYLTLALDRLGFCGVALYTDDMLASWFNLGVYLEAKTEQ